MLRTYGVEPLSIWVLFIAFTLLARRDRRLLYWLPVAGAMVLVVLSGTYVLWCLARGTAASRLNTTFVHWVATFAGGLAIPALWSWLRTGVARDLPRLAGRCRAERGWIAACLTLAVVACVGYYVCGRLLAEHGAFAEYDTLFESDANRYALIVEGVARDHQHVVLKHPLFALLGRLLHALVVPVTGSRSAPSAVSALAGGLCLALAAQYFRLICGSRLLALILAATLGITSAHLVFAAAPETYSLAAATLVLLHLLLAGRRRFRLRLRHEVFAGVLAVGITVASAYAAVVCFFVARAGRHRARAFVRWLIHLAGVVGLLLVVQSVLLPPAALRTGDLGMYRDEQRFVARGPGARLWTITWNLARGLFAENVVGPSVRWTRNADGHLTLRMGPYDTPLSRLLVVGWLVLFAVALGILAAKRVLRRPTLWAALICLAGSAALHSFYGNEYVFLYSCTFTFFVWALVAHALTGARNIWVLVGIMAFTVLLLVNNIAFFGRVLEALDSLPNL